MNRIRSILATAVASLLATGTSFAHTEPGNQLIEQQLRNADLVFRGIVTAVEYRNSEASREHPGIPHTFVTFQIEHLYKPRPSTRTRPEPVLSLDRITLRFLGGVDVDPDRVMRVSDMPIFDVGDRDFLLVEGNGQDACPLIDWDGGRFRVVDGLMYNNDGQELDLDADGILHFGPRVSLFDIDSDQIGAHRMSRVVDDPANEDGPSTAPRETAGPHMTADVFDAFLEQMLQTHLSEEELTRIPKLIETDPARPFRVSYANQVVAAPREREPVEERPSSLSEPQEIEEFDRFNRSNQDPRLGGR